MFTDTRMAGPPRYFANRPKDLDMRIPNDVLDCVVFVGRVIRKGSQEEKRLTGTAFIVSMPSQSDGLTTFFYLVTAKHVAEPLTSGGEWFIRFNTKDEGCAEICADERIKWWTHPDPQQVRSVDVAVMPSILPDAAKFTNIPVHSFLTPEILAKQSVGPGSDVYITGLFTKMMGRAKNIPIMRMANVAMIPQEKTPNIKIGQWIGDSDVYLLEARSLGGLSGSPAFVLTTSTISIVDGKTKEPGTLAGLGQAYFMGLMNGHWLIREHESNNVEIESVRDSEGSIATGISVVVPAQKILEVLRHPELEAKRIGYIASRALSEGTTVSD